METTPRLPDEHLAKAKELAQVLKRLDTVSNVAEVMERLELPEAHIGQV